MPKKLKKLKKKRIPVSAAGLIAKKYGYHQVVIYARNIDEGGGEHVTTYGINKEHCASAAMQGKAIQKLAGWSDV